MGSHLETFKKGWENDDVDMILSACSDDFVYDDPFDGRFTKAQFADYYRGCVEGEVSWSDAVREPDSRETVWMWWTWKPSGAAEGSHGAALIKATADGIHSAKIVYYTRTH